MWTVLSFLSLTLSTQAQTVKMCVAAELRDKTWTKAISDPLTQPWNDLQIKTMLVLLPRLRATSASNIRALEAKLNDDFANTFPKWDQVVRDDCTMARLHLLRPLINAAVKNGKLRLRVQNEVLDELRAPRALTLMITMVGFIVLQHALDRKLWAVDDKFLGEFAAARAKIKQQMNDWQKDYAGDPTKLEPAARQVLYVNEVKRAQEVHRVLETFLARLPAPAT